MTNDKKEFLIKEEIRRIDNYLKHNNYNLTASLRELFYAFICMITSIIGSALNLTEYKLAGLIISNIGYLALLILLFIHVSLSNKNFYDIILSNKFYIFLAMILFVILLFY